MVRWIGMLGLGLAGFGAFGLPLSPFDAERLADQRTEVLVFAYLGVFGQALQLAFFAGLAWIVDRDARGRALGRLGLAGNLVQVTAVTAAFTIFAALAHLVVAATFARHGAMAPDGAVAHAVPILFFAWIAAVGWAVKDSNLQPWA